MHFGIEPDEGCPLTPAALSRRWQIRGSSPHMTCPFFLLPLWEKVARCGSASSRMRGALPLSRSHLPHRHSGESRNPASCLGLPSWTPTFVGVTKRMGERDEFLTTFLI